MNNDLISREALRKAFHERIHYFDKSSWDEANALIDNAPTVKTYCYFCGQTEHGQIEERPQGEFVEMLKDRIEESVCKYCQMNKHCELCEISRVFQIITLTAEEQKVGAE